MRSFEFPERFYAIVDTLGDPGRSHETLAAAMLIGGVRLLQLRVKDQPTRAFVELARAVQARAAAHGAALIINDRADIAQLVGAAGVHLGQDDLPAADARRLLGRGAIIGVSTHTPAQAAQVAAEGVADYLGFGPIYATTTKANPDPIQGLNNLRYTRLKVTLPIVAIGGITLATVPDVLTAGADAVAVIRDVVAAPDVSVQVTAFRAACRAAIAQN